MKICRVTSRFFLTDLHEYYLMGKVPCGSFNFKRSAPTNAVIFDESIKKLNRFMQVNHKLYVCDFEVGF